jgi:hypothetical protein
VFQITIDDQIGNTVGAVGICILAGVLLIALCYLWTRSRKSKDSLCKVLKASIMTRPTVEKHVHKPRRKHRKHRSTATSGHGANIGHTNGGNTNAMEGLAGKGVYSAKGLGSTGSPVIGSRHSIDSNARASTPPIRDTSTPPAAAMTTATAGGAVLVPIGVQNGLMAPPTPMGGVPGSPSFNRQMSDQNDEEEESCVCRVTFLRSYAPVHPLPYSINPFIHSSI